MIKINLEYWKYKKNHGNFGDELSVFIINCLINKEKYHLVYNQKNIGINLVAIGSYIGKHLRKGTYIFGSGIRTLPIKKFRNLKVFSVRGPLTQQELEKKNPHLNIPKIYGDPGLLLSIYYKPIPLKELQNKIGIVPHFSNYSKYKNMKINDKFYLIDPTNEWKNVINEICSCSSIVSSSLHGLICSDAYGKPNLWIDEFKLDEGHFKFYDYFKSQDREIIKITNLKEIDEKLFYKGGNKINLDKLIESFPFK